MLKTLLKAFLIVAFIGVTFFIGLVILVGIAFGSFDKDYYVSDLIKNFNRKKVEIYDLKEYFISKVPDDTFIEIEFEDHHTLQRIKIKYLDSLRNPNDIYSIEEWDLKINSLKMDSILHSIGWNHKTLKILEEKLDKANCIGINSENPVNIGFKRSKMGRYSFNVFDQKIPNHLRKTYNDSCRYILVDDYLVLEYGGGAIGTQCFYNF